MIAQAFIEFFFSSLTKSIYPGIYNPENNFKNSIYLFNQNNQNPQHTILDHHKSQTVADVHVLF